MSSGHSSMSTSSLLEANDIVWELVKKIVYKQRQMPDLSTCPIGKVSNVVVFKERMA
jgi:hypothetical protein